MNFKAKMALGVPPSVKCATGLRYAPTRDKGKFPSDSQSDRCKGKLGMSRKNHIPAPHRNLARSSFQSGHQGLDLEQTAAIFLILAVDRVTCAVHAEPRHLERLGVRIELAFDLLVNLGIFCIQLG